MPSRSRCSVNLMRGVLAAGVGVMDQLPVRDRMPLASTLPHRHPQRRHHELYVLTGRGVPGHDPLGVDVEDERDIDPPGPRSDIGEVGDPDPVRPRSGEVAVQQVPGAFAVLRGDRGPQLLVAAHARETEQAHAAVHAATRGVRESASAHERGHLPPSVEPFGGHLPDPGLLIDLPSQVADLVDHDRVTDDTGGDRSAGLGPVPVGARGDLHALLTQDSADRLDRVPLDPQLVDEGDDQRLRGSSSPAKKIEARRRISLSSSSLRTLALSFLISSCSSVVTPAR